MGAGAEVGAGEVGAELKERLVAARTVYCVADKAESTCPHSLTC